MGKGSDTLKGAGAGAAAGAVLGPWGAAAGGVVGGAIGYFGSSSDEDASKRSRLNGVGNNVGIFADDAHVQYQQHNARLDGALNDLQARANGQNSISALQLHQSLQQNLAAQRSLQAGAGRGNAGMAARQASMNSARMGYGLAGQQALAGLAERAQAQDAYGSLLSNSRGQDITGALGGYNAQTSAYAGGLNGQSTPNAMAQWAPVVAAGAAGIRDWNSQQDKEKGK